MTPEERKLMNDCFRMLHKFAIQPDGGFDIYVNTSTGEQEWSRGTIRPPMDDPPAGVFVQHLPGYDDRTEEP